MHRTFMIFLAATFAAPIGAWAHGEAKQEAKTRKSAILAEEKSFGREGDPGKVSRTIAVDMGDTLRFAPGEISVKHGETIRFVVKNSGKLMHEMVLGTIAELKEHAQLMQKHPEMEHDEPYMAHVQPGKSADMVWQFTKTGEFHYGCLVPGHFEAGMIGKIVVRR